MARLFGTDGIRGEVGTVLTADLVRRIGAAAGSVLGPGKAVVGMDTRASGPMLEAAVIEGLSSAGIDVIRIGVVSTPGVAYLTVELGAAFGVVLSASHNPAPDNGVKIIGADGRKISDELEDEIEAALDVEPGLTGRVSEDLVHVTMYEDSLVSSVAAGALAGLRIVADCAHGAACAVAPRALRRAGADVITIGCEPNGHNINDGVGATHLEALQAAVLHHGADAGVAFDGDADRCLAVDHLGRVLDGDQILLIIALAMRADGRLPDNTVVATVMSNLGFARALEREGLTLVRAAVGDRHVLEEMLAGGHVLGGEQSGHFIVADRAGTGDGVLAALQLLATVRSSGKTLAELGELMTRMPQVLINCKVSDRSVVSSPLLAEVVAKAAAELGSEGRILVRPSGTESLIRVMVEADTQAQADQVAEKVAAVVRTL